MRAKSFVKRAIPVAVAVALGVLLIVGLPQRYYAHLPFVQSGRATVERGAAVPWQYQVCSDVAMVRASWWYNWGMDTRGCDAPGYMPMVWCMPNNLAALPRGDWLLGPNEPDNPDQCNKTPEQIAEIWPQLVATGRQLVSPAVLQCEWCAPGYLDDTWLERFMALIDQNTVDVVAVHYYGCDADKMIAHLEKRFQQFGKPIWVTEWVCPYSERNARKFMRDVLKRLPSYVQRQAWFATRTDDWSWLLPLVGADGKLTTLGREYAR